MVNNQGLVVPAVLIKRDRGFGSKGPLGPVRPRNDPRCPPLAGTRPPWVHPGTTDTTGPGYPYRTSGGVRGGPWAWVIYYCIRAQTGCVPAGEPGSHRTAENNQVYPRV